MKASLNLKDAHNQKKLRERNGTAAEFELLLLRNDSNKQAQTCYPLVNNKQFNYLGNAKTLFILQFFKNYKSYDLIIKNKKI